MTEHTELPWISFSKGGATDTIIKDSSGGYIGRTAIRADGELIVRAVNSHDALVSALEKVVELVETGVLEASFGLTDEDDADNDFILRDAKAALKIARGES